MYAGDVVPKDVNVAATIKTPAHTLSSDWSPTRLQVQAPAVALGGHVARVMRTACMISDSSAIAEMSLRTLCQHVWLGILKGRSRLTSDLVVFR